MHEILVVDDHENTRLVLSMTLKNAGYEVKEAKGGKEALEIIKQRNFDLVITDLKMKKPDGFEILDFVKKISPQTEIIVITAYASINSAVRAMRLGAYDYIAKPFQQEEIVLNVKKALEKKKLKSEVESLKKQINDYDRFSDIIGKNDKIMEILKIVETIKDFDVPVLIQGESGTGKELFARAIHKRGNRCNKPFIAVNCGALPENLQESELFGHVKGAFTGAFQHKRGLFEEANNGIILLDEIGEMTHSTQVKLLRALENGEVRPVGGNTAIKVKTRIFAASNRDLNKMVENKLFRKDLLFRINVIQLNLPPLRERKDDIPVLVEHFLRKYCSKYNRSINSISSDAYSLITNYEWPGNVRELENVIERAVILCKDHQIKIENLNYQLKNDAYAWNAMAEKNMTLEEIEKNMIMRRLETHDWNQTRTAASLGISISTLWRKIKNYDLKSI